MVLLLMSLNGYVMGRANGLDKSVVVLQVGIGVAAIPGVSQTTTPSCTMLGILVHTVH